MKNNAFELLLSGKPVTTGPRKGSTYLQYEPGTKTTRGTISEFQIIQPSMEVFRVGVWSPTVEEILCESWQEWGESKNPDKEKADVVQNTDTGEPESNKEVHKK